MGFIVLKIKEFFVAIFILPLLEWLGPICSAIFVMWLTPFYMVGSEIHG